MTVAEALRAAALYVEEHGSASARNGPEVASDDERASLVAEVSALGRELDSLSAASETARVYRREVEAVVCELRRRGVTLPPEVAQAVADAFQEADPAPKAAPARRPSRRPDGHAVDQRRPPAETSHLP